jgi:mannonate dehydratase
MKITDAKVIVCSPGRNFVTLKIMTDQGVYGLGDATLNGRELAVAKYLEEYCIPALIGKDPRNIEDIWHFFYRGVYWKRGGITMTAISAIDVALWDIKGKILNTPIYNLLGGKSRDRVMVYAHANGVDLDLALESVAHELDNGFRAIRVQSGIPGLDHTYGVAEKGEKYEPAGKGLQKVDYWDTHKYLNWTPKLFSKVREHFGEDLLLLHDVHHRLTPIEAGRLGKELEPFHLYWMEDAVSGELQEGLKIVRQHTTTPLAIGEVFNSVYDYTMLISQQLIDFVRMPIVHGGGITHLQKVTAFASIYHVQTGFHGATDLSPVNLAAALHFDFAINNFGIQEYMPHEDFVDEVFKTNYSFEDGYMYIDEKPGLGVDIDEVAAARFPYERASLPVNRKSDGTMFYW